MSKRKKDNANIKIDLGDGESYTPRPDQIVPKRRSDVEQGWMIGFILKGISGFYGGTDIGEEAARDTARRLKKANQTEEPIQENYQRPWWVVPAAVGGTALGILGLGGLAAYLLSKPLNSSVGPDTVDALPTLVPTIDPAQLSLTPTAVPDNLIDYNGLNCPRLDHAYAQGLPDWDPVQGLSTGGTDIVWQDGTLQETINELWGVDQGYGGEWGALRDHLNANHSLTYPNESNGENIANILSAPPSDPYVTDELIPQLCGYNESAGPQTEGVASVGEYLTELGKNAGEMAVNMLDLNRSGAVDASDIGGIFILGAALYGATRAVQAYAPLVKAAYQQNLATLDSRLLMQNI